MAQQGYAAPRGKKLDPASLRKHVLGESVNAGVTSWSKERYVAEAFAGEGGLVLEVEYASVANRVVPRPPIARFSYEEEVLLKGRIDAKLAKP